LDDKSNPDTEPVLRCIACGGEAELIGRCCRARVKCLECGADWPVSLYMDQIEKIKEFDMIQCSCCDLPERDIDEQS